MKQLFIYYGEKIIESYSYKIIDEKDMKTLYIRKDDGSDYETKYNFTTTEELVDFLIKYKENIEKIVEMQMNGIFR